MGPLIRVPSSGGKLPDTVTNPEWAKATAERMKSWEREGAPDRPIKLNPIKSKCARARARRRGTERLH